MIWLGIDTSNSPLSVAIVQNGVVLAEENTSMAINHSLRAMSAISELFEKVGMVPAEIDAIAVSESETDIANLDEEISRLQNELENPVHADDHIKLMAIQAEIDILQTKHDTVAENWLDLQEELESL